MKPHEIINDYKKNFDYTKDEEFCEILIWYYTEYYGNTFEYNLPPRTIKVEWGFPFLPQIAYFLKHIEQYKKSLEKDGWKVAIHKTFFGGAIKYVILSRPLKK
jgi:hypothetical protein